VIFTKDRRIKFLQLMGSIVRHDLVNQICGSKILLELILQGSDCEQREDIEKILSSMERMQAQLEFWRASEAGADEPSWQRLGEIYNRCEAFLPKNIKIILKDEADIEKIKIFASPCVSKVLENLADNTMRHGEHASEIVISFASSQGNLLIFYEDNGIGIRPEDKPRIFEKGFGRNTGLGLFLIKEILALTEIKISETGELGKGVRFEIEVPKNHWTIQ
jgi:signal transduction histidine kinase